MKPDNDHITTPNFPRPSFVNASSTNKIDCTYLDIGINQNAEVLINQRYLLPSNSSSTRDTKAEPKKLLGQEQWVNSTVNHSYAQEDIYQKIEAIFEAGKEENFEDGMESEFSRKLISFIKKYGDKALEAITSLIVYEKVNAEVATEALRWLGDLEHTPSYSFRLWLLERSLRSSKARIRDGAILGLSSLNDPHAISYLKLAIEQEMCTELRKDMEQVLAQLESIGQCHSS